jgi:hypothetical protein
VTSPRGFKARLHERDARAYLKKGQPLGAALIFVSWTDCYFFVAAAFFLP